MCLYTAEKEPEDIRRLESLKIWMKNKLDRVGSKCHRAQWRAYRQKAAGNSHPKTGARERGEAANKRLSCMYKMRYGDHSE